MEKSKIILEATADLKDNELREAFSKLSERVTTLNERTKSHTLQIRELTKLVKSLEEKCVKQK